MAYDPRPFLAESDLFRSLSSGHRAQVAAICLPRKLRKRELLFTEGERGHAVYLCARGSVRLFKSGPGGQEVAIRVIPPGEVFAEVILFEQNRYPVSAIALEDGLVFLLPRFQFECLLADPGFRRDFIANLIAKMRYLAEQVQSMTTDDVESRFFRFLEAYGGAEEIRIPLSKKDVAAAIGTTPETLSRVLLKLRREGRLFWEGRRVWRGRKGVGGKP